MAAFYVVAFLSGYIAEELKKKKGELIQKQVDYDQLETFNRNVIQSLDSGLLTINLHGQINFANRTAEKILNRNAEELKKLSIDDLFPNHNEVFNEIKKNTLNSPWDYQRYETVLINHEGKKVYLGFSISPLTAPGGSCIGYTLIFQDITNVKEMEEQVKRSDKLVAIGQLAAGLAHEIRNPLTSLSGSIQMLKSELVLDHPNQRLMDIILRESERLNALITDFLLFAKPPKTNKKLCEIGKILEETIDLFTHSLEYHQNVRIRRLFSDDHIQILIDPDQMKQVFWNLLMNAVQAMVNGGELSIDLKRGNDLMPSAASRRSPKRKSKEWVKIFITDAGNGIDPKDKRKIFDPFFTTKERGTGLGLSIVHKIIENHNGVIKVESEVGKGSTFILFLPVH
jgi:two-component system sensor histidine kinase PilS (NtrC family)